MNQCYDPYGINVNITDNTGRERGERGSQEFPCTALESINAICPCHWHDEFEFIYVLSGNITFQAGEHSYALEQGDGLFINATFVHSNNSGTFVERVLQVHPRFLYGSVDSVIYEKYFRPLLRSDNLAAIALYRDAEGANPAVEHIRQACMYLDDKPPMYEYLVREELTALYRTVWELAQPHITAEKPQDTRKDDNIKHMMEYLQQHIADNVTMDDLSTYAHLSPRECQRSFQSYVGTTPFRYLTQLRLNEAASLLRSSDMNITEICFRVGYQDAGYFARQFKQHFGISPRAYRLASLPT